MAANVFRPDDRAPRHLSLSNEHATPVEVIEAARTLLGGIDLDPASCALANDRVKAFRWCGFDSEFPELRDGLSIPWNLKDIVKVGNGGNPQRVFLNPPGGKTNGQSSGKVFWFKLAEEYVRGHVHSAVFLGFSVEILQTTQVKTPVITIDDGPNRGIHTLPIPLDFPICIPARRLRFDKMLPRCTFCDRFIDSDRAALLRDSLEICHPKFKLTDAQKSRVERTDGTLDWWRGPDAETAPGWICMRDGVAGFGPLDFCTGDSPPHSNVIVYLPPERGVHAQMSRDDAIRNFQVAFADIGRVR